MGNMISRVLRLEESDDKSVPNAQNPNVPKNTTIANEPKCAKIFTLKNIINSGRTKNSMIDKNIKLLINFPK